jgi:hypothetical protein
MFRGTPLIVTPWLLVMMTLLGLLLTTLLPRNRYMAGVSIFSLSGMPIPSLTLHQM